MISNFSLGVVRAAHTWHVTSCSRRRKKRQVRSTYTNVATLQASLFIWNTGQTKARVGKCTSAVRVGSGIPTEKRTSQTTGKLARVSHVAFILWVLDFLGSWVRNGFWLHCLTWELLGLRGKYHWKRTRTHIHACINKKKSNTEEKWPNTVPSVFLKKRKKKGNI